MKVKFGSKYLIRCWENLWGPFS